MFDQRAILTHHLQYNHYPPIVGGEDFAMAAVAAVQDGRGDEPLTLGTFAAPSANDVVTAWHLDYLLGDDDESF